MELILATGNAHKREELGLILAPHTVLTPADIGVSYTAEETGTTYLENAFIKAQALAAATKKPVLADDSGLTVPAMDGEPGVLSARYGSAWAGRPLDDGGRNAYLLKKMVRLSGEERRASFVCCMVLLLNEMRVFTVQETFDGFIADAPSGSGGFGYDPLFYLPRRGMTVAELPEGEKNRISHRGRAGSRIKAILDDLDNRP